MRLNEMVGGWMTDNPVTLTPERPVIAVYALMAEHEIRHVPVVEDGRLVGLISDRDLHQATPLGRARKPGDIAHLFTTPVSEIMTKEGFVTVDPQTTLGEAAKRLVDANVHSLPVLDGDRLVGILTTHDILRAVMGLGKSAR